MNRLPAIFVWALVFFACTDSGNTNGTVEDRQELAPGTILKTPEERFYNLIDYPWEPNYLTVEPFGLQMHYVEAGPEDGPTVLLLHGNPNWSYGLRELIALFAKNGYHVYAPDLIGFGKSDKPTDRALHTYDNHESWIRAFITGLDLSEIHLNCQDWGGLIGLRVAVQEESRFKSVSISNTDLPTGENVSEAFLNWQIFSQTVPNYSYTVQAATYTTLTSDEEKAFDAPFPSEAYKAGPRQLPLEVPTDPKDQDAVKNIALWGIWENWTKPFLTIFSEDDAISPNAEIRFQQKIPGAQGQPHLLIPNTGHFIREDVPERMFIILDEFIRLNQ